MKPIENFNVVLIVLIVVFFNSAFSAASATNFDIFSSASGFNSTISSNFWSSAISASFPTFCPSTKLNSSLNLSLNIPPRLFTLPPLNPHC